MRMIESPDGLHFPLEADDCPLVVGLSPAAGFSGDNAVEPAVYGLVDCPHAAAAQPLDQAIFAKVRGKRRLRFWQMGTVPFSLLRNAFGLGDRTAAFRFVQIGLRRRGPTKLADQRIFDVGKRRQLGLAVGARFHVGRK